MITARIAVKYDENWTTKLGEYDAYGKFLAYKFADNQSFLMLAFVSTELDAALEMLRRYDTIEEVEVLNRNEFPRTRKESAVVLIRSRYREIPPMQLLTYEGFYPLGDPLLENKNIYFDLFLDDRDALARAVVILKNYGEVSVKTLSRSFGYQTVPEADEFEELLSELEYQQLELLSVAAEKGHFADLRESTLNEIAEAVGMDSSTASKQLRAARRTLFEFLLAYSTGGD